MFLGVPRIWEKLHAAISIKLQETGGLRRALFGWAYVGLCALGGEAARAWRLSERAGLLPSATGWSSLAAELHRPAQRAGRADRCGTDSARRGAVLPRAGRSAGGGVWPDRIDRHGHRPPPRRGASSARWACPSWASSTASAEHGELLVRGDMVFAGYYKSPEATGQQRSATAGCTPATWCARSRASCEIVDRLKDIMITAGGKNLTPSEIENTMKGSPFIKECIIVAEGAQVRRRADPDRPTKPWASGPRRAASRSRISARWLNTPQVRELIQAEIDKRQRAAGPGLADPQVPPADQGTRP